MLTSLAANAPIIVHVVGGKPSVWPTILASLGSGAIVAAASIVGVRQSNKQKSEELQKQLDADRDTWQRQLDADRDRYNADWREKQAADGRAAIAAFLSSSRLYVAGGTNPAETIELLRKNGSDFSLVLITCSATVVDLAREVTKASHAAHESRNDEDDTDLLKFNDVYNNLVARVRQEIGYHRDDVDVTPSEPGTPADPSDAPS